MKLRLLDYLVCPECRGCFECNIALQQEAEIIEGSLTCKNCQERYYIRKGIPRFFLKDNLAKTERFSIQRFTFEWRKFQEFSPLFKEEFLDIVNLPSKDFFKGKIILDAGCGNGRFSVYPSRFGAKEVICIDANEAVEVAFEHTKDIANVHIVQANIYNLPFKNNFDYIYIR